MGPTPPVLARHSCRPTREREREGAGVGPVNGGIPGRSVTTWTHNGRESHSPPDLERTKITYSVLRQ